MEPIKAYYDGRVFVPVDSVKLRKNQQAIITLVDDIPQLAEQPWRKFFGVLSPEQCAEIEEALKDTERIDRYEW